MRIKPTFNKATIRVFAIAITAVMCTLVILSAIAPFPEGANWNFLSIGMSQKVLANPDWLSGWGYCAPITISNSNADYQTKVTVYEGSGTNGANVVYCGGHCKSDFSDLRFAGSDFVTLLDYWIESVTGTTPNQVATVWVQNNATPSTTGRIYYGNPAATAVSNGDATFIFFDDFRGTNWVRQGNCLVATSCEPTIIYEGSPQILTEETNVFKMWYRKGWTTWSIYYAESTDGLNWTDYSGNPILSHPNALPNVLKYNSIYYLFDTTAYTGVGIKRYHSSNGVTNWIDDGVVLPLGSAGQWDDVAMGNNFVWVETGTWYMLYEAKSSSGIYKIGLATSSNGTSWTKDTAHNPVISKTGARGNPWVYKSGSYYYCWLHGASSGELPTDIYKMRSADLITWIDYPGLVFERITADEGVGTSVGQVADSTYLEYNGKVYMWYSACSDGNQESGNYHIKLAIIDKTLEQLKDSNEDYYVLTDKWNNSEGLTCVASGGILSVTSANVDKHIYSLSSYPTSSAIRALAKWSAVGFEYYSGYAYMVSGAANSINIVPPYTTTGGGYASFKKAGAGSAAQNLGLASGDVTNYCLWDVLRLSTSVVIKNNGVTKLTYSDTTYIPTVDIPLSIWNYNSGLYGYFDFILVRKYAATEPSFAFGSEQTAPIAPTVTTQSATNIISTSCTGNGNITATGGENATTRGFCYMVGQAGDPTTANSTAHDTGSYGTGTYSKSIIGLSPSTYYRVRAYAINSAGTGYGTTVQVTTLPGDPSALTDTAHGGTSIDLSWTKGTGADKALIRYRTDQYPTGTSDGTQAYFDTGTSTSVGSLSYGQIYYFRAWAYNTTTTLYSSGTSDRSCYTDPNAPTSLVVTERTYNSIALSWTLGTGADKTRVQYRTDQYPTTYSDGTQAYFNTGTSINVTSLSAGQIYYFRAWSYDTDSGYYDSYAQLTDYTLPADPSSLNANNPTVSTINVSWTKGTGGDKTMVRYAKVDYPTYSTGTQLYFDTGTSQQATSLNSSTIYYFRCWSYDSDSGYHSSGYSSDTETTLTPAPEITNTPDNYGFGVLEVNTTSNTAINYFTLNNTGNCPVDVVIYGTDVSGGDDTWDLSDTATPGENIYGLYAGLDDADDLFDIIVKEAGSTPYNYLKENLVESATQNWGLKIYMPTSVSGYNAQQMSGTITLVASASS